MKKLILIIFLFSVIPVTANAQFQNMSLGLRAGISLSSYTRDIDFGTQLIDESSSSNNLEQFTFGLVFSSKVNTLFGFQAEGMYIKKGGNYPASNLSGPNLTPVSRQYKTKLDYIQFSLIPKLIFDQTPSFGFFAGAGGYAAFLTKGYEEIKESTFEQERLVGRDISESLSGTEAGLVFLGGVNFNSFTLEGRYNLGLTNIIDDTDIPAAISSKTRTLSFLIGYNFGF